MNRLRQWLGERPPLVRLLISFALGGAAALSMPPLYIVPVLFPALIGLYWLVQSVARVRTAFFAGWFFGFGYFVVGLYWIGNAFMVYAARHALLAIPAVVGLALLLGLFIGGLCAVHRRIVSGKNAGLGGVIVFAVLWTVFEWLRSWVLTGFPWNLLGSTWAFSDTMIQGAAFAGTYGLSLITVVIFCAPATLADGTGQKLSWHPVLASLGGLALLWGSGAMRLSGAELAYVPDVRLRLVQPNIPQDQKWKPDLRGGHVLRQLDMSRNATGQNSGADNFAPTHVIWAETAVPFVLSADPALRQALASAAPEGGVLITGSLRSNIVSGESGKPEFWNSLFAIDPSGDVVATYDKEHLVPFGEYVPLKDYLPFEKLTAGAGQFTPGAGRPAMLVPGLPPFSPLICYEIIFPGAVLSDDGRPDWLLNLTNDAWYGISAGPYQHFVSARLRAVEEGLPVVRAANTGISGVVDGYGRVVDALDLGTAGVLDARLPHALPMTAYGRYHDFIPMLACGVLFLLGMAAVRRNPKGTGASA